MHIRKSFLPSVVAELTSPMSSLTSATMATDDVSNYSTLGMTSDKPFEEFVEAKIATWINRIYVPILVGVGLVFNSLCFVTFVFTSLHTTSTCVYMAAIAVLDSSVLVQALCSLIRQLLGHTIFYMRSKWICGFQFFLFYFAIHFDVLVLLAMTVDRFIVVKFPLKAQSWCTPKSAIKVITGVGIFSFALNFQIFFNRILVPTGNVEDPLMCVYPPGDVQDFMDHIYTIIDASIYSFIPFVSLLTLNLLIIRQLKQAHKFSKQFTDSREARKTETLSSASSGKPDSNTDSARKSMTSTNINVMFLLVSFTFLLLTSPVVIVLMYGGHIWQPATKAERAQWSLVRSCVENIMYSNHAVNFLLYCISGRRFRQELWQLLKRFHSRF